MSGKEIIDKSRYFLNLQKAIKERAKFLEDYPELVAFQKEIDKEMEKAGNGENRMALLKRMLDAKTREMKEELLKLQKVAKGADIVGHWQ